MDIGWALASRNVNLFLSPVKGLLKHFIQSFIDRKNVVGLEVELIVVVLGLIDVTTLLVVDLVDAPVLIAVCFVNALLTQQYKRAETCNFFHGAVSKHHKHKLLPGFDDGIFLLQVVPELIEVECAFFVQFEVECNRPNAGGDDRLAVLPELHIDEC